MRSFICFLFSTIACVVVVSSAILIEKRKDKQQTVDKLIAKMVTYIMCAILITIACRYANSAESHISSAIYISLVFVCQGVAGFMKKLLCPYSQWSNFKCYIEGFVIALAVIFGVYGGWTVSVVLCVYVIAFYFNFNFEDFNGQFLIFIKSLPYILFSCLVWLGVLGLGHYLNETIKAHRIAVAMPWVIAIVGGHVSILVIKSRKRLSDDKP